MREIHVSLPLIVELIEKIDQRRIAHDVTMLRWTPLAFRLRWIPSFAKEGGFVLLSLLRLVAFHAGKLFWNSNRTSGTGEGSAASRIA